MDFAWLSQIAFKSLGCNPNSNAISVQFLDCFLEDIDLERERKRERDIFHRLILIFSLLVAGEDFDEMEVGFTTFFFSFLFSGVLLFMDIFLKSEPDKRRL